MHTTDSKAIYPEAEHKICADMRAAVEKAMNRKLPTTLAVTHPLLAPPVTMHMLPNSNLTNSLGLPVSMSNMMVSLT